MKFIRFISVSAMAAWVFIWGTIAVAQEECSCHGAPIDHEILAGAPMQVPFASARVEKKSEEQTKSFTLHNGGDTDLGEYCTADLLKVKFRFLVMDPDDDVCEPGMKDVYAKIVPKSGKPLMVLVTRTWGGETTDLPPISLNMFVNEVFGTWDFPGDPGTYAFVTTGMVQDLWQDHTNSDDAADLNLYGYRCHLLAKGVDLDIDSDHTHDFGGPDRNDLEEEIEEGSEDERLEGLKFVVLDDRYDVDKVGLPGYADGFDLDNGVNPSDDVIGEPPSTIGPVNQAVFVPIVLEIGKPFKNPEIRFVYRGSNPLNTQAAEDEQEKEMVYEADVGRLRIWTKDQKDRRNGKRVNEGGDYIEPNTWFLHPKLNMTVPGITTNYVEGIRESVGLGKETIEVIVMETDKSTMATYTCRDKIALTVIRVDLDVDSNNDDGFNAPKGNLSEDHYEDIAGVKARPGKIIQVSDGDVDQDHIIDWADGFDQDGNKPSPDDQSTGKKFIPVEFELCSPISVTQALIRFTYDASDPGGVHKQEDKYVLPAAGRMRLWTKDGGVIRDKRSVGNEGNWVSTNEVYTAEQLGITKQKRRITLYAEAVTSSVTVADLRILVEVDPDGNMRNPPHFIAADAARMTAARIDLDIDSDNNNGIEEPDRGEEEDRIEETIVGIKCGKVIMENRGDDDGNGVPDYADYCCQVEEQLVPLILDVTPAEILDLAGARVRLEYDGEPDRPTIGEYAGESLGNGFTDYRTAKKGKLRIWAAFDYNGGEARDYVKPGSEYNAEDFLGSAMKRTFLVEGINGVESSRIKAVLRLKNSAELSDQVVATVAPVNLGVNCNDNLINNDNLRVGVPDVAWMIDDGNEDDEVVEDQRGTDGKYGLNFWWGRDAGTTDITPLGLADLAPFKVDAPQALVLAGFKFYLELESFSLSPPMLHVYPAASAVTSDRLFFLKDTDLTSHNIPTGMKQIALASFCAEVGNSPTPLPPVGVPGEFVFKAVDAGRTGQGDAEQCRLVLYVQEPGAQNKIPADSCVLTLKACREFYPLWSARTMSGQTMTYPVDGNPGGTYSTENIHRYADAVKMSGPEPDAGKRECVVSIHGYRVGLVPDDFEEARFELGEDFKRLFWTGFRGNYIGFAWHGDEGGPVFAPNVENAFQTAYAFMSFLSKQVCGHGVGRYGVNPNSLDILAHSLGTQVAVDAMRLYQVPGVGTPGQRLVRSLTLIESATWGESYWGQGPVSYPDGTTYNEQNLRRMSWTFFFNQRHGANPMASLGNLINSYNRNDHALWIMRGDDYFFRNINGHYVRMAPGGTRNACHATPNRASLAHSCPALLGIQNRRQDYEMYDLVPTAGQDPMGMATANIDAGQWWWRMSHKGQKGGLDADFWDIMYAADGAPNDVGWWDWVVNILGETYGHSNIVTPLPQIWDWFMELNNQNSYAQDTE